MKPSPAPSTLNTSIGKPGPVSPSSRLAGIAPVKATAPIGAALADQRGARDCAHRAQRLERVGGAAGDVEFLLGADDQVEEVQRRLQLRGHLGAFDEPALALAVPRHAPEVRPVVDVERRLRAVLARAVAAPSAPRPRCCGWLRCVPVATTARASAMNPSSMSSSHSAMSAQFSR